MTTDTPSQTYNEAPVSWNVKYITADGYDCQLTLRDTNADTLLKRTVSCLDWLRENGAQPTRTNAPSHAQSPAPVSGHTSIPDGEPLMQPAVPITASQAEEIIEVNTISHGQTDNGVHYILVKGGKYGKFGIKCWEDKVPVIASRFKEWPVGQSYDPPSGMELAVVSEVMKDGKAHKKVTAFMSK